MTYDVSVRAKILSEIADGRSLRSICSSEGMPSKETVREWLLKDPEFAAQYARAREEQADSYADEIVAIADEVGDPNDKRVRIDARKWIASKLKAKKYGDKLQVDADVKVGVFELLAGLGPEAESRTDS